MNQSGTTLISSHPTAALADIELLEKKLKRDIGECAVALLNFTNDIPVELIPVAHSLFVPHPDVRSRRYLVGDSVARLIGNWIESLLVLLRRSEGVESIDVPNGTPLYAYLNRKESLRASSLIKGHSSFEVGERNKNSLSIVNYVKQHSGIHPSAADKDLESKALLGLEGNKFAQAKALSYLASGVAYKGPIVETIIEDLVDAKTGISCADIGGGRGYLLAEIGMSLRGRVEQLKLVDHSKVFVESVSGLNKWLATHGCPEIESELATAESVSLASGQHHLVSYIGSLLYVDKAKLHATLQKSWNAIRKGGVLVVHENIKRPAFVADYDVMFTVDDLERALSPFGEIQYYSSTVAKEIPRSAVGEKTVFRVIKKK